MKTADAAKILEEASITTEPLATAITHAVVRLKQYAALREAILKRNQHNRDFHSADVGFRTALGAIETLE